METATVIHTISILVALKECHLTINEVHLLFQDIGRGFRRPPNTHYQFFIVLIAE